MILKSVNLTFGLILQHIRKNIFKKSMLSFSSMIGFAESTYQRLEKSTSQNFFRIKELSNLIAEAAFSEIILSDTIKRYLLSLYEKSDNYSYSNYNIMSDYNINNSKSLSSFIFAFFCLYYKLESSLNVELLKSEENSIINQFKNTGLIGIWKHRAELDTSIFINKMKNACNIIEVLGYAVAFIPEHPMFNNIISGDYNKDLKIRMLLGKPNSKNVINRNIEEKHEGSISSRIETSLIRLKSVLELNYNFELRLHDTPLYCSIYRIDDEMFVTPHLYGVRGSNAPMMQYKNCENGLFESYCNHFNDIWEIAEKFD